MANWAISIGINNYDSLQALKYAKRDAETMRDWFEKEAKFDKVFLFTEDSAPIPTKGSPIPTQPTFARLQRFLDVQFEKPLLKNGDNLWFFFAGHGIRAADGDHLMLLDSNPNSVRSTAISVNYITERLRRCGADNVVLFLDACRNEGDRSGLGIGTNEHQGVITFYYCAPNQKSYEIDELQHGSFTAVLLDGLKSQGEGNCATVERLEHYLQLHVPKINEIHKKSQQNPYAKVEPSCKKYFILLEKFATKKDIEPLKFQASLAENIGNFLLAEQLWIRVLAISPDFDAIEAIKRITLKNANQPGTFSDLSAVHQRLQDLERVRRQDMSQDNLKEALRNLQDKLDHFEYKLSITASTEKKFELKKQIEECNTAIQRLKTIIFDLEQEQQKQQVNSPNIPQIVKIELKSEKGVDYYQLRDLLAAGKWREADRETARVMCLVAGREEEGWLREVDIDNFPCEDLRTINQLWLHYSNGKFGFSVQKEIYQSLGSTREYNEEVWIKFCDRVGWRVKGKWLSYDDLTFNLSALEGHLPLFCVFWFSGVFVVILLSRKDL